MGEVCKIPKGKKDLVHLDCDIFQTKSETQIKETLFYIGFVSERGRGLNQS